MRTGRDAASAPRRLAPAIVCLFSLTACGEDPTAAPPVCEAAPALAIGTGTEGRLQPGDARYEGAYIDYYSLAVPSATQVVLRLSSAEIDPFLYVFGEGLTVAAQAYSSEALPPGAVESAILARHLEPGCHLIGATSWTPDVAGGYQLSIEGRDAP